MMCREKTEAMLPARPAQGSLLTVPLSAFSTPSYLISSFYSSFASSSTSPIYPTASTSPTSFTSSTFSTSPLTCNALAGVDTVAGLTEFCGSDVYEHHVVVGTDVLDHPVDGVCHLDPHKVDALQPGDYCEYTHVCEKQVDGGVDKAYERDEYTEDKPHEG